MVRILQEYAKRLLKLDKEYNKIKSPTMIDRAKLDREVRAVSKELNKLGGGN